MDSPQEARLNQSILDVARYKQLLVDAQVNLALAQDGLIAQLQSMGWKSHEYANYRATVVSSETVKLDEKGLKKALGARVYNRLTTAKLDKKKLEAAVEAGQVDSVLVAQNCSIANGSPYIRITERKQ